jgi:hypothetical protein
VVIFEICASGGHPFKKIIRCVCSLTPHPGHHTELKNIWKVNVRSPASYYMLFGTSGLYPRAKLTETSFHHASLRLNLPPRYANNRRSSRARPSLSRYRARRPSRLSPPPARSAQARTMDDVGGGRITLESGGAVWRTRAGDFPIAGAGLGLHTPSAVRQPAARCRLGSARRDVMPLVRQVHLARGFALASFAYQICKIPPTFSPVSQC